MRKSIYALLFPVSILVSSISANAQTEFLPQVLVFNATCDQASGGFFKRVDMRRPSRWLPPVPLKPYCEAVFKFVIDDAKRHIIENPVLLGLFMEEWTHYSEDLLRISKGEEPLKPNVNCHFADLIPTNFTGPCDHIQDSVEQWKRDCGN